MRALVFDGVLRLGTLPRPAPRKGEVVVDVSACAISRADVDMVAGRRSVEISPAVLGHQFVGIVAECGPGVDEIWRGKRVVGQTVPGCGRCGRCRHGFTWQCEQGVKTGVVDRMFPTDRLEVARRSGQIDLGPLRVGLGSDVLDDEDLHLLQATHSGPPLLLLEW